MTKLTPSELQNPADFAGAVTELLETVLSAPVEISAPMATNPTSANNTVLSEIRMAI
jgi:hypothetical protein